MFLVWLLHSVKREIVFIFIFPGFTIMHLIPDLNFLYLNIRQCLLKTLTNTLIGLLLYKCVCRCTGLNHHKASMKINFWEQMKLPSLCPCSSKCKVWQRCGCQRRLTSLHWVLTANLPDGELYWSRDGEIPRLTCLNTTQNREPADSTHRWEALLRPFLRRLRDEKPKN